jgi:hypothetical protein
MVGGSDSQIESTWKWVTGPEGLANGGTGTTFFGLGSKWNYYSTLILLLE